MLSERDVRIKRLFHPEYDKTVIIPVDHGYYLGVPEGLEDPYSILQMLLEEEVDATIMNYGMIKITNELFTARNAPARIIAIDNCILSNIPGEPQYFIDFEPGVPVELALKSGFDAVKVLLIWGLDPDSQAGEMKMISELVRECDRWGMPLIIEPLLMGKHMPSEKRDDPDTIAHASRIAVELGADILKIQYTGDPDHFRTILERARIPVIILGGAHMGTPEEMLRTAKDSVAAGGRGIAFGRVVWGYERMRELIRALKEAVYLQADEKELVKKYNLS